MTIDQLNALSDYEINCAVADIELPCDYEKCDKEQTVFLVNTNTYVMAHGEPIEKEERYGDYNPCNNAGHYMGLAIKHRISIIQGHPGGVVWCDWDNNASQTGEHHKSQTGRAVCIAFLLMNGESND